MVFVKPSPFTWACVKIVQRTGFAVSFIATVHLLLFILPAIKTNLFPQVDHNPYQSVTEQDGLVTKVIENMLLLALFWFQHSTMARPWFKSLMNHYTNNQYYFFEKGTYSLLSGSVLIFMIFLWQPLNQVIVADHNSKVIKLLCGLLTAIGFYMQQQSNYDLRDDVYGFAQLKLFKKQGLDMPTPFIPKRLSRVALSCRNPLYSGMMLMFLAALCYGEVTLGRALFLGLMIIGTLLGSTFEERQLQRTNREFFERYRTLNPNRYFPRLKIIFGSKEIINEFTKQQMIINR